MQSSEAPRGSQGQALANPVMATKAERPRAATPARTERKVRPGQTTASQHAPDGAQSAGPGIRAESQSAGDVQATPKIILFQQWMSGQLKRKNAAVTPVDYDPDEEAVRDIVYSPASTADQQEPEYERCVGWTD
jgi:hypothetical protein